MHKLDILETVPIIKAAMDGIMRSISPQGRPGSDCRTAIGDLLVHSEFYLFNNTMGAPLDNVFELARLAGASLAEMEQIRLGIAATETTSLGATLTRDSIVQLALATQAQLLIDMTFTSRQQVEDMIASINTGFGATEELLADAMDAALYRTVVELHASLVNYLTTTAQPLARIVKFQFANPLATLQAAYRLYTDASRGDELRDGNKVVHPAFMLPIGQALAS